MKTEFQDFQRDVLDQSQHRPVLVDFWAAWCGPCQALGPVLERLADEAGDRWALVKIDTEAHPDLAARFSVRSIPNLKLFYRGAIVAELTGALPEPQLRAWLDEHLPSPGRDLLLQAQQIEDPATRLQKLEEAYALEPDNADIALALARELVFSDPDRAQQLAERHRNDPRSQALQVLSDLPHSGAFTETAEGAAVLTAWQDGDWDRLLGALVQLALLHPAQRELARPVVSAIFNLLGPEHPATQKWRRKADMALY